MLLDLVDLPTAERQQILNNGTNLGDGNEGV